jgi:PilZ domain
MDFMVRARQEGGDMHPRFLEASIADRRKNERTPANDPARIKVLYPTTYQTLSGRILDRSQDGLKVEVRCVLEPGMLVEVLSDRFIAIAEVRYCVPAGGVFHAGVRIQDAFAKPELSRR